MNNLERDIVPLFDEIAVALVMAEPGNISAMKDLQGKIVSFSKQIANSDFLNPLATDVEKATALIGKLVLKKSKNLTKDYKAFTDNISEIQRVLHGLKLDAHRVERGNELDTNVPSEIDSPSVDIDERIADENILKDFLSRQDSILEEMEQNILSIEKYDDTASSKLKRLLHTLKGEAGVLGLDGLERVCHACEEYINSAPYLISVDALLMVKDWFEGFFSECSGGNVVNQNSDVIVSLLKDFTDCASHEDDEAPDTVETSPENHVDTPFVSENSTLLKDFICEATEHLDASEEHLLFLETNPKDNERLNNVFRCFHTIKGLAGFLGLKEIDELAHNTENLLDNARKGVILLQHSSIERVFKALDKMRAHINKLSKNSSVEKDSSHYEDRELASQVDHTINSLHKKDKKTKLNQYTNGTLKVDTTRLDKLVDAIGEMAIAASMVCQDKEILRVASPRTARNLSHLEKITRELQNIGMSMRMVPIRSTFQKMARLVRDLAKSSGKQIEFSMDGEDTELDRSVVEKIGDPLIHLVRNAVDHGVEDSVEERHRHGKPSIGSVSLRAFHKGGNINIEIEDDGKGLDREAIIAKARRMGILHDADSLTDHDVNNLIFHPGFSTAQKVTSISGRGVGMDVVRQSILGLRGQIDIDSVLKKGTKFSMRLPLTLAVIDGLVVVVGTERYVIPTLSVVTSLRITQTDILTALNRSEMFFLQDMLHPLFRLNRLFGIPNAKELMEDGLIVVVEDSGKRIGLFVDELLGKQQVVIKSLGDAIQGMAGVSGGAIMPDGRVGLILDVAGVINMESADERGGINLKLNMVN